MKGEALCCYSSRRQLRVIRRNFIFEFFLLIIELKGEARDVIPLDESKEYIEVIFLNDVFELLI